MEKNAKLYDTHYVAVEGQKIAYRKIGDGAPLILINRFRGTLDVWDPLFLELLAETHTVITFDYPGVGYSEGELPLKSKDVAEDVMKLAKALELDTFDVLGWSYGGLIAQAVALMYPEHIKKAILVGTNPPGKNEVPIEDIFKQTAFKPTYDLEDYTTLFFEPKSETSRAAAKASFDRTWPHHDVSNVPATMELMQRYAAGMQDFFVDEAGLRTKLKNSNIPMLILSGDHDISFALENWYPVIKGAKNLHLLTSPETGHGAHIQNPELATDFIKSFLKKA